MKNKKNIWIFLSLITIAALSRLLPHPPNFTAIGSIALFGIASELIRDSNDSPINHRIQLIQQHSDEQVKFDKMIQLLDSINLKSKKFKD